LPLLVHGNEEESKWKKKIENAMAEEAARRNRGIKHT
jgi:hypothetical protein